jgi:hypothetical protein
MVQHSWILWNRATPWGNTSWRGHLPLSNDFGVVALLGGRLNNSEIDTRSMSLHVQPKSASRIADALAVTSNGLTGIGDRPPAYLGKG